MRLADGTRQIVAALLASLAFLGLYFGLLLVWWLALGLAAVVYGAALLLIARRPPLSEVRLAERVSAADVATASQTLDDAARRLTRAGARAPQADRPAIAEMADHLAAIRTSIVEDPEDYRAARSFINVYLPQIVQSVEGYAKLAPGATGESGERVARLGAEIRGFVPVLARIRAACIENDISKLELEVGVLSDTFKRR